MFKCEVKMSEEEKITYTLYRGPVFVLSGSRDTIKMYLRMTLDRWEETLITDERKAWFLCGDRTAKAEILAAIMRDKHKAFAAFEMELQLGGWEVRWPTEDGMHHVQDATKFFLDEMKNE